MVVVGLGLVRGEVDGGVCKGGSRWVGVKKERGGRFYELYSFFSFSCGGKVTDIRVQMSPFLTLPPFRTIGGEKAQERIEREDLVRMAGLLLSEQRSDWRV